VSSAWIDDEAALEALYGAPMFSSLAKEIDHVDAHYAALVAASPFCAIASAGPGGLDVSPRGDGPGFVAVADPKTLLLPDRRGNNRADTLKNILADPRVALLFLIPGVGETLRVNGTARISIDADLCRRFAMDGKPARSVLVVAVERVYFQCARAIVRADLWNPAKHVARTSLPSTGTILEAHARGTIDAKTYDAELPKRLPNELY
jgi:uncharacterized protein